MADTKATEQTSRFAALSNLYDKVTYTPNRCRYDPEQPPEFTFSLNLLFAFAACFTVADLYYSHPVLNILAEDFHVSFEQASLVPTLSQAGYAIGLLFLCPLGDLFPRRTFILWLIWFTGTLWIGLCITTNFNIFLVLSFITCMTTVTPQLILPLVGDLAPVHRRATALSYVVSGMLFGMLIARVLSGILTQYTSWRIVYWLAFGLQYLILILLYFFMPDYPSTNPSGLNYFKMLWSIVTIARSHPLLIQASLVGFFTSTIFTGFWTTLSFLLSELPFNYPPLYIGLFAFIGIAAMCLGPLFSRVVIDRYVPLFSTIIGETVCLTGVIIGTFTGTFTVAGPVIQAFTIDAGLQITQIANRSAIYTILPQARNRVNTVYMVSVFVGQLVGTTVGNHLFAEGGWIKSGSASIGFVGAALVVCFCRGPWEKGWIGWSGGWSLRRRDLGSQQTAPSPPTTPPAATDLEKGSSIERQQSDSIVGSTKNHQNEKTETEVGFENK